MFIPELDRTVAELDAATKNAHSHRARAMALLVQQLREVWGL
jgi:XTP/dITP diphosphohydrolase